MEEQKSTTLHTNFTTNPLKIDFSDLISLSSFKWWIFAYHFDYESDNPNGSD